jgi:hypothetical protein
MSIKAPMVRFDRHVFGGHGLDWCSRFKDGRGARTCGASFEVGFLDRGWFDLDALP